MSKYQAGVLFGEELEALYKDAKENHFALPAVNTVGTDTINATLYPKLSFNFLRDIAPVAGTARTPYVVVVNNDLPVKTIPDLIELARKTPGKYTFASSGSGTTPQNCS